MQRRRTLPLETQLINASRSILPAQLSLRAAAHLGAAVIAGIASYLLLNLLPNTLAALLIGSSATVALVVFGFPTPFASSSAPDSALWRIFQSLTSRESLLPLGLVTGMIWSGHISLSISEKVLNERVPIIVLILTFAIIAGGIGRSGFFYYVTTRTLLICRGSVPRLTISIFALAAGLTYVTSNDVVTLMMIPIVLEISRQPGLRDFRTILLIGCFIAANTLSMGLLFGSPTNIIVAVATGIGFPQYVSMMAVPTIVAGTTSLLLIALLTHLTVRRLGRVHCYAYDVDAQAEPAFHYGMPLWVFGFAVVVAGYSYCLATGLSFYYVSVPAIIFAIYGISITDVSSMQFGRPTLRPVTDVIAGIPYGIIGFAISFFMVAFALVEAIPTEAIIRWLNTLPMAFQIAVTMLATAGLVNSINDLPAAATVSILLEQADNPLFIQSSLTALNIGCYLTPIGALAGIIFFHMLRQGSARYAMQVPKAVDLMKYGAVNFVSVTIMMCLILPGYNSARSLVIDGALPVGVNPTPAVVYIAVAICVFVAVVIALIVILRVTFRESRAIS